LNSITQLLKCSRITTLSQEDFVFNLIPARVPSYRRIFLIVRSGYGFVPSTRKLSPSPTAVPVGFAPPPPQGIVLTLKNSWIVEFNIHNHLTHNSRAHLGTKQAKQRQQCTATSPKQSVLNTGIITNDLVSCLKSLYFSYHTAAIQNKSKLNISLLLSADYPIRETQS